MFFPLLTGGLLVRIQVLQDQFPMAAERRRQRAGDQNKQLHHALIVAGIGARFHADEF